MTEEGMHLSSKQGVREIIKAVHRCEPLDQDKAYALVSALNRAEEKADLFEKDWREAKYEYGKRLAGNDRCIELMTRALREIVENENECLEPCIDSHPETCVMSSIHQHMDLWCSKCLAVWVLREIEREKERELGESVPWEPFHYEY